jgi:hypothetical protein
MHQGEISNVVKLLKSGEIHVVIFFLVFIWMKVKYARRVVVQLLMPSL